MLLIWFGPRSPSASASSVGHRPASQRLSNSTRRTFLRGNLMKSFDPWRDRFAVRAVLVRSASEHIYSMSPSSLFRRTDGDPLTHRCAHTQYRQAVYFTSVRGSTLRHCVNRFRTRLVSDFCTCYIDYVPSEAVQDHIDGYKNEWQSFALYFNLAEKFREFSCVWDPFAIPIVCVEPHQSHSCAMLFQCHGIPVSMYWTFACTAHRHINSAGVARRWRPIRVKPNEQIHQHNT